MRTSQCFNRRSGAQPVVDIVVQPRKPPFVPHLEKPTQTSNTYGGQLYEHTRDPDSGLHVWSKTATQDRVLDNY